MLGKNRIVNKHGLKMVGLKSASGITKRILHGIIFWDKFTGYVSVWFLPKTELYKEYGTRVTCSITYDGPMTMQEIADAIYEEYREEMAWRETAEENGWRVKE